LKYEPRPIALAIRPFIEAGYAWRTMSGSFGFSGFFNQPIGRELFEGHADTNWENSSGFVWTPAKDGGPGLCEANIASMDKPSDCLSSLPTRFHNAEIADTASISPTLIDLVTG
jgi:hypothetical protein